MSIQSLIDRIPAPPEPFESDGDWNVAESEFGVKFPTDFKQLIRHYGTGEFVDGLEVFNPLTVRGRKEILNELKSAAAIRDSMEIPLVLHPDRPGLLPWGRDDHGHQYFWWTKGRPHQWSTVVLFQNDEENPYRVPDCITTFLLNRSSNKYATTILKRFDEKRFQFKRGRPGDKLP